MLHDDYSEADDLPPGWHEVVSRSTGRQYYWNAESNKSQFERPLVTQVAEACGETEELPLGWARMYSRSTGRPYYHNRKLKLSQFTDPRKRIEDPPTPRLAHAKSEGALAA